jgi:N4-gp56 family major capsid protein
MNRQFFDEFRRAKSYLNLSDISSTTARGASYTGYSNQKTFYSGQLSDAAKSDLVALSSVEEVKLPKGNHQYLARYRTIYPDESAVTFTAGENTSSAVGEFNTNYKTGEVIEPTQQSVAVALQWNASRNNIYDLMRDKQEELSYAFATKIEKYILQDGTYGLMSASIPTATGSRGALVIYGGSNTSDAAISIGDGLTVAMLNEAKTRLRSPVQYYRSGGYGALAISSVLKNPWKQEATDPFVGIIGADQTRNFLDSSQFINAEQYGGREPLLNGEIGKIFKIKLVESDYLPTKASGASSWDGSGNATANLTRCILMKGRAAYTFVWGQEPTFEMDKEILYTKDTMVLWATYAGAVVHDDAIVFMDVATLG